VAEVCLVDAGRPDERQTKARHRAGGGLEARRGPRRTGFQEEPANFFAIFFVTTKNWSTSSMVLQ